MALTLLDGTWVSDDCQPVEVKFGWPSDHQTDCICAMETAAALMLFLDADDGLDGRADLYVDEISPFYRPMIN